MRKVTQDIRNAFMAGQSRTIGNTHTDGQAVWLHGNKIVERRTDGIYFTLAGWNTPTTRERVNGIAGASVYQKNFEPMIGDSIIDPNCWFHISG